MSDARLSIRCDTSAIMLFAELLQRALEGRVAPLCFDEFGPEDFRLEQDNRAAGTDELIVRLYPSDYLLRRTAAAFAGDFNLDLIEQAHGDLRGMSDA